LRIPIWNIMIIAYTSYSIWTRRRTPKNIIVIHYDRKFDTILNFLPSRRLEQTFQVYYLIATRKLLYSLSHRFKTKEKKINKTIPRANSNFKREKKKFKWQIQIWKPETRPDGNSRKSSSPDGVRWANVPLKLRYNFLRENRIDCAV
jgi:hypothetical protein